RLRRCVGGGTGRPVPRSPSRGGPLTPRGRRGVCRGRRLGAGGRRGWGRARRTPSGGWCGGRGRCVRRAGVASGWRGGVPLGCVPRSVVGGLAPSRGGGRVAPAHRGMILLGCLYLAGQND